MLHLWVAWSMAQDVAPQQMLHDAVVLEGVYGDLEAAVQRYQLVVRNAAMDDATRARALTMLGRALYDLGRVEAARNALFEGRASGVCNAACVALLQALVIEQETITEIPAIWDFEASDHGFFHPIKLQDLGAIRLAKQDGEGVLEWETVPPPRGRDRLVVGLNRPRPVPREVELSVTSGRADVRLMLLAEDELGRRYAQVEAQLLPRGQPVRWTVPLATLRPTFDGPRVPLDAARITRLVLEPVASHDAPNVLLVHDVAIR